MNPTTNTASSTATRNARASARPTPAGDHPDIARVGALLADRSRAGMLFALTDGRALPASLLATEAGVSTSTASGHLSKPVDGGLVTVEPHGRHRYFHLAGPDIAMAVESLAAIAPQPAVTGLRAYNRFQRLRSVVPGWPRGTMSERRSHETGRSCVTTYCPSGATGSLPRSTHSRYRHG